MVKNQHEHHNRKGWRLSWPELEQISELIIDKWLNITQLTIIVCLLSNFMIRRICLVRFEPAICRMMLRPLNQHITRWMHQVITTLREQYKIDCSAVVTHLARTNWSTSINYVWYQYRSVSALDLHALLKTNSNARRPTSDLLHSPI